MAYWLVLVALARTEVQFLAPLWWFTKTNNDSYRVYSALFRSLQAPTRHSCSTQTHIQANIHTHRINRITKI